VCRLADFRAFHQPLQLFLIGLAKDSTHPRASANPICRRFIPGASIDRYRAHWHGMIAAMGQHGHDPIAQFIRWLDDARRLRIPNYEAMALATAARDGKTSVRFVLLKGVDERGLVFFTDARSRKGRELDGNPRASLAFYWQGKGRQVRVEGSVEEVTPAEADAYWPTRPRQSQLAASASHQSARLRSRAELLERCARLTRKFKGHEVPRPPYWTGFRVRPDAIEFWTHREHRLHDREIYFRRGRGWRRDLLQP
jgi:pyridoxamine 5'-phosphate oxidase